MDSNGNYSFVTPRELTDEDIDFLCQWTNNIFDKTFLKDHVVKVHEEIRQREHVYRCISAFSYLTPKCRLHPKYQECIELLLQDRNARILDLGTCFGQEVRGLIQSGVDPSQITASDLLPNYWNAGKDLFLDNMEEVANLRGLNQTQTLFGDWATPITCGDITDNLENYFDVIICWAVFHVLSKEQVDFMIRRIFRVLKPGGILIGSCRGARESKEWVKTPDSLSRRYLHNASSLAKAFESAGFLKEKINVITVERPSIPLKDSHIPDHDDPDRQQMVHLGFSIQKE